MWWLACAAPVEEVPWPDPIRVPTATLSGSVGWTVDFAQGEDCGYARVYDAVEDRSVPWACPACETLYTAEVDLLDDGCRDRITASPASTTEWIGFGDGVFYRSSLANAPLLGQGTVDLSEASLTLSYEAEEDVSDTTGEAYVLSTAGTLQRDALVADPWHGLLPPAAYVCGWPKADPPPYQGDYDLDVGKPVPDAIFADACGQGLRLADLEGRYVVLEVAAVDCGPCQAAAATEEPFVDDLRKDGVEVIVVTLLAPSLSDVLGVTDVALRQEWAGTFGLSGPVVWDRGYGLWVLGEALGDGFAYPSFALLDPKGRVLDVWSGFGSWDDAAELIAADAR